MTHYQYATTYITPNSAQWWQTHCKGTSHPVWQMLLTLCRIADNHKARYASNIGDDGVLGDHWEQMVQGLWGCSMGTVVRWIAELLIISSATCWKLKGLKRNQKKRITPMSQPKSLRSSAWLSISDSLPFYGRQRMGHCDYATDRADRRHLLDNYRLAYGVGWSFKTILLPTKYWPKKRSYQIIREQKGANYVPCCKPITRGNYRQPLHITQNNRAITRFTGAIKRPQIRPHLANEAIAP